MTAVSSIPHDLPTLERLQPLVSRLRIPPFDADLWESQNPFYHLMAAISSLKPSHLTYAWLQRFRHLGDQLGIAVSPEFPAAALSSEQPTSQERAPQAQPMLSPGPVEQISQ